MNVPSLRAPTVSAHSRRVVPGCASGEMV